MYWGTCDLLDKSSCTVTGFGTTTLTDQGICSGTSANPTIANNKISESKAYAYFTSWLPRLPANTKIYARAYAVTPTETVYGNEVPITTPMARLPSCRRRVDLHGCEQDLRACSLSYWNTLKHRMVAWHLVHDHNGSNEHRPTVRRTRPQSSTPKEREPIPPSCAGTIEVEGFRTSTCRHGMNWPCFGNIVTNSRELRGVVLVFNREQLLYGVRTRISGKQ